MASFERKISLLSPCHVNVSWERQNDTARLIKPKESIVARMSEVKRRMLAKIGYVLPLYLPIR